MNEEPISTVPDYNVKQPDTGWFRFLKAPADLDGYYTPFWPLVIVFASLIFLLFYEVSFLRYKRLVLLEQKSQYDDIAVKEKDQAVFIKAVTRDLAALAPTDPLAAAIMKDFFPQGDPSAVKSSGETPKK